MNTTSESSITELRAELIEAGRTWSAGQHRLISVVGAIDRSNLWIADGATSAASWVAAALDIETCTAREWVRIARMLALLPLIDAAFGDGVLSYSKVRAVTRVATPGCEAELLELAQSVPANHLHREIAAWRAQHEDPGDTERRQHRDRSLSTWVDHDGMMCGHFRLPPLAGGSLVAAIETDVMRHDPTEASDASADASRESFPSLAAQRADALARLLTTEQAPTYEVVLHVRGDGDTLNDGTPIPRGVIEHIAPQAFIRALIHDADGRPVNASGRQRHPNTRQRRVVDERDRGCVDCGATHLPNYDHVPAYETSRHTIIDELQLRCAPCHRRRHDSAQDG